MRAWRELFPRVVGLKMFAGHSTGQMGIVDPRRAGPGLPHPGRAGVHGCAGRALRERGAPATGGVGPGPPGEPRRARGRPAAEVASVDDQKTACREGALPRDAPRLPHLHPVGAGPPCGRHEEPAPAEPPTFRVTCGLDPAPRAAGCKHDGGRRGHAAEGEPAAAADAHASPDAAEARGRGHRLDRDRPRAAHAARQDGRIRFGVSGVSLLPGVREHSFAAGALPGRESRR